MQSVPLRGNLENIENISIEDYQGKAWSTISTLEGHHRSSETLP